jgi:sodium/potassium-transporting ATPase subunit alpha
MGTNSAIGESMPIAGATESTDSNYLETRCIGLQGTHCVSGSGIGICVATGDNTIFGRVAKLSSRKSHAMTLLQKEVLRFVIVIVTLMLALDVLVLILW